MAGYLPLPRKITINIWCGQIDKIEGLSIKLITLFLVKGNGVARIKNRHRIIIKVSVFNQISLSGINISDFL